MLHVEELNDKREWQDFLDASPDGTFYHSLQWKEVLERSFHDSSIYLTVRDANGIVGICPGFILSRMRTKIYSSMPYSDYGGPVIATHCMEEASLSLQHFLERFCSGIGVAYLKMRFTSEQLRRSFGWPLGYLDNSLGTMEIDLEATPSHLIWNSLFSKNRRWKMKRFEREGYQAQQARTKCDLRDFYRLYYDDMRHIGARPYPYDFLENMWTLLYPVNVRIWIVAKEEAIGGILVLKDARRTYWLLAGMDRRPAYSRYPVVNYLLWKEIQTAEEEGYRRVSLGATGRDPNSVYYLQKSSFGGSFNQQKVAYYPCSSTGRALLRTRAKLFSASKTIRGFLPVRLKRILQRELSRFR